MARNWENLEKSEKMAILSQIRSQVDEQQKIDFWGITYFKKPSLDSSITERRYKKMDIAEYIKSSGTFLKAEDIKAHPESVFVITSKGEMVTSEKFGNLRLHLTGEFNKEEKTFDCSKTNARVIAETLGTDTEKWIGKTLVLEVYKTKVSDGRMVDAINVKGIRV